MHRVTVPALCASVFLLAGSTSFADPLSLQHESYAAPAVPSYLAPQYAAVPEYDRPEPPRPVGYQQPQPAPRYEAPQAVRYEHQPQQPVRYAAAPAQQQQQQQTNYGGGLIEFLFGGQQQAAQQQPANVQVAYATAQSADVERARPPVDPKFSRQVVMYNGPEKPGTIVIDTNQRFLFLVQDGGRATRYGIGVGRDGFTWHGVKNISAKKEWPDWVPPPEMLQRRPDLPAWMAGGPENPLGARALYLGSSLYRIHGSNEPWTIGQAVSSGCFRMKNDDVIDLFDKVKVGTKVVVI